MNISLMKHVCVLSALLCLASATAAFSGSKGQENKSHTEYYEMFKGKTVFFVPLTLSVDANMAWAKALEDQSKELGYTLEVRDANWKTDTGSRGINEAIAKKADLLVLQNPDVQSYARMIRKANQNGVKVIQLNMESLVKSDGYIGADWQAIGEMAGEAIVEHCAEGKGPSNKVQIVAAVPNGPCDLYQTFGFKKVLAQHPEIEIVSEQATGYESSKARAITATVLQQHPDLCGSWGMWDNMDTGTGAAVKEAGKSDQVFVISSGSGNKAMGDMLEEGIFSALINWDIRRECEELKMGVALLLQSDLPAGEFKFTYYTPLKMITKENYFPSGFWIDQDL